jgi:hypothetical protein
MREELDVISILGKIILATLRRGNGENQGWSQEDLLEAVVAIQGRGNSSLY